MAEPTETDRDVAYRALWPLSRYRWPTVTEVTAEQRSQHERVAQALADERERAFNEGALAGMSLVRESRAAEETGQ